MRVFVCARVCAYVNDVLYCMFLTTISAPIEFSS